MAQPTTADPGVGAMSLNYLDGNTVPANNVSNNAVRLNMPIFNFNQSNAIPQGSTKVIVSLGSRAKVDSTFDVRTAPLSTYFSWTYDTVNNQIVGDQIAPIPADFGIGNNTTTNVTSFVVRGRTMGNSTFTGRFAVTNHNTTQVLSDTDPNNNNTSLQYTVSSLTLPVRLTQFDVVRTGCSIDVSFATGNEVNVNRYEIEVSKNGNDFVKLSELSARNAGTYKGSYQITDAIRSASLFVRLKSVDNDGRFEYSSVRRVAATCDAARNFVLNLYPNPVTFSRSVTIVTREGIFGGKYNVSLLDVGGRTLQVREMDLNNVTNFKFDIGNITPGQYLIRVSNTDRSESAVIRFQKH